MSETRVVERVGSRRCAEPPGRRSPVARLLIAGALASVTLLLVACGDDEAGGEGGGPLRVGLLTSLSGPLAALGEDSRAAAELYVEEHPEIAGRPIELITRDDESEPRAGIEAARDLTTREEADAVVGIISSAVLAAVAEQILAADTPLIVTTAGAEEFTLGETHPFGFRVGQSNGQYNRPMGWYAYEDLGHRRVAVLASDYIAGEQHSQGFIDVFTELGGEVVGTQNPPLGAGDFGPYISGLPDNIDAVYTFLPGEDAIRFWQQAQAFGLPDRVDIIGSGATAEDVVLPALEGAADGYVGAFPWVSTVENDASQAFLESFEEQENRTPSMHAASTYLAFEALAAALEDTGGELGDPFSEAIAGVELQDSLLGPFRFDENHQAVSPTYIFEVDGDQPTILEEVSEVTQTWEPTSE